VTGAAGRRVGRVWKVEKIYTGIFGDDAPVEGGYIDVWTETEGASFDAYGSVLDNATSDPTTVLPQ
jgi:hypothetical protein